MEVVALVLLLVVLASMKRKPSAADAGLFLPALRMSAALLFAVLIGLVVVELF